MAVFDLQIFLQERARVYDENIDLSPGSPFDTDVIQPVLRRLGRDPFTIDLALFLRERMRQAFPDAATDEGDAITDLLIKPATLLWDPFVREVFRIRNSLSFKDPTILTTDEAEALGANLFSTRKRGDYSRGTGRIYFAQPRQISLNPTNFFTSKAGLHYFVDGVQSITTQQMLLNTDGTLYYFDVNLIAESPGVQYDIEPSELISVANIDSAVRVTNLRRFRGGSPEESAVTYVARAGQELTERSMVTLRGIGARVPDAFPEVTRLAVVGFNDPEMQRDIIQGGGLGAILSSGSAMSGTTDGENKPLTRRIAALAPDSVDFTAVIGPAGSTPDGYVLTLNGAFGSPPFARDLTITRVVSTTVLEVSEQVINPFATGVRWTIRKRELTLSGIPGGILFPDSSVGQVTIPNDSIHIGGMFDIHVRGTGFDESSVVIDNVTDDEPGASGTHLTFAGSDEVSLDDYVMGTDYAEGDTIWTLFDESKERGFTLQILDGPNAGNYRVIDLIQMTGASPLVTLDSAPGAAVGDFRWRLVDTIEIDLVEPKESRVEGADLETVQNTDIVETAGSTDFGALGVSVNDTLRILNGPDAGDYVIQSLVAFNQLQLDRPTTSSSSNLSYRVFRSNAGGGVQLPLIRITDVELLDTAGQPVGSKIPYAKPIDIQSRAFQNPGRGVKVDILDATLGIVTDPDPGGGFPVNGQTLNFTFPAEGLSAVNVAFSGTLTAAQVASAINLAAVAVLGANTTLAVVVDGDRVGIVPIAKIVVIASGTARGTLFGAPNASQTFTTADIRSLGVSSDGGWVSVTPAINQDDLDVVQVLDGLQIGFYGGLHLVDGANSALVVGDPEVADYQPSMSFAPEINRHIQVGSRSIGSARCYFLEPTSIEFDQNSFFSVTLATGATLRFYPDPTVGRVRIPAAPSTVLPKDGSATQMTNVFTSASQNFVLSGIRPGDILELLYVPITTSTVLTDPVTGLALQTLVLSVNGGADQTIIFVNDLAGFPNDVSRDGVADQINDAVGRTVARIDGSNRLVFEADVSIVVRSTGTANSAFGLSTSDDSPNASPQAGRHVIIDVAPTTLTLQTTLQPSSPATVTNQAYTITRPGSQRCSSTEMTSNVAEAGLYYFDVELVSEGTGDLWNVDEDLQFTVEGYRSDGYYLTTEDSNLTFSSVEQPKLHLSRSILESGVADDPQNATQITGQNISINYERSALAADVQNFASSETERVVNANPLARHLIPHFVRFDFNYTGGSRAEILSQDMTNYINGLFPSDLLEAGDLNDIAYRRGAISVQNPIDLIAIVHNVDRSVFAQRSQNSLNTGRLAAFIPDILNVNRRTS